MPIFDANLAKGVALGLASALHCSTMCGGIACGANLLLPHTSPADRHRNLALLQVGRIATYAAIGSIAATLAENGLMRASTHGPIIVQWLGAASLLYMGLALAGWMPRLSLLDAGMLAVSSRASRLLSPAPHSRVVGPLALGCVWGLSACPMVYGAALFASLTGGSADGAIFMLGFGIGTVPAVIASAYGLTWLRNVSIGKRFQHLAGLALMLAGVAIVYEPLTFFDVICKTIK